jgi:Tfp pilus assembly protein PilP
MKLTTVILIAGMATGSAWGQNPNIIKNTKSTLHSVQVKKAADSNAALDAAHSPAKPFVATPARKASTRKSVAGKPHAAMARQAQAKPQAVSVENAKTQEPKKEEKSKPINLTGRRDPFVSPVVSQSALGSGCSVGKRCLAVEQINLKGVVKAESGMIAVVVNALDKAYFLRENDPVFNGYVVKITGDSIVFRETVQDRLGKSFTREVTKKITTPAV